jgi:DNA-binding NarL/FixJ family response regulator
VDGPPLRILLAEDDAQLAHYIETLLHRDGRFVVVGLATNGDDAVRLCEERAPDLVLMDIGMPLRDGIEATRAIHARDENQHVVIYTGSDEYDDVQRADAVGVAGFLNKNVLASPDLADALHVLHVNFLKNLPDPD